ncbi:MAG: hypothetical protein ACRDTH_05755 [Pseudonocardiaceae bacterium]
MHDLDRAMFETGEVGRSSEHAEHEEFLEILGEQMGETSYGETQQTAGVIDRTSREMELAAELLGVQTEAEWANWFGNLARGAVGLARGAVGKARDFAQSPTGRALGGIVKDVAGQALPAIGGGIGGGLGKAVGEGVGKAANMLIGVGQELEGLSAEDREFEVARAVVRFADAATRQAAQAPPGAPPKAAALAAATAAAKRHAPGLVGNLVPGGIAQANSQSGRWERRGDRIVIFGA